MRKFLSGALAALMLGGCVAAPASTQSAAPAAVQSGTALAQVNQFRAAQGRGALRRSAALDAAARAHANDMARGGFFAHRGSDGGKLRQRLQRAGYGFCAAAENLAYGSASASGALAQWRGSPSHRANMLGARYSQMGLAQAGGRWVMVLAAPRGSC
ncbi:MAG: CAP domain-containing protein [Sulfitobacter sp.]